MSGEIIVADGDSGLPEDEDTCRNGRLACAGPAAFDLSPEFPVPICAECAREATCSGGNRGP